MFVHDVVSPKKHEAQHDALWAAYDHSAPGQGKRNSWCQRAAVRRVTVIALSSLHFATFRRHIDTRFDQSRS
jgi:hypothetical protein